MRLGEIKQKIDLVVDENKIMVIDYESLYGNHVYKINNYKLIIDALKSIKDMGWNDQDFSLVQEVIDKSGEVVDIVNLEQSELDKINSYIAVLNQKMPIFVSMINSVVENQDEKCVNIKLAGKISSIQKLTNLNNRLDKVLGLYNLDGQFDFKGFDKGTEWYVMLATGQLSYWALIGGLNIANKFFETQKSYYDSKTAKFNYKNAELEYMAATDKKDVSKDILKKYVDRKLKLQVRQAVEELSEKIDNTNNKIENLIKMIKATEKLIKELETKEFEFHLSLNPPKEIVSESGGSLTINHDNLPKISDKKVKKIESKKGNGKK